MWSYIFESVALYIIKYKPTSQVSLVTSKIISFICPPSWTSNFFSVNALALMDLIGSVARSESHLLCCEACDWLFATDVTHSCAHAPQTQDQSLSWQRNWWSASWYQQSQIGVLWFCQLETNPVTRICSATIMVQV